MADANAITVQYYVDRAWYDQHNRSFEKVVQSRMCPSCQNKLGKMVEEPYTTVDPKGKRVVTERRKVPYGANPLSIIRDCCSRSRDYVEPGMPVMEIVFRLLLARANQPITVEELQRELVERAGRSERVRFLTPDALVRMLDRDQYYGIRRADTAAAGE